MKEISVSHLLNKTIDKIADDSHVAFFVGIMFTLAGILSLFDKVIEDLIGREIEFFHGAIFLGIFNLGMSMVFIINGARNIEVAEKVHIPSDNERIALLEIEIEKLRASIEFKEQTR